MASVPMRDQPLAVVAASNNAALCGLGSDDPDVRRGEDAEAKEIAPPDSRRRLHPPAFAIPTFNQCAVVVLADRPHLIVRRGRLL
jgi:hypothetical protein